MRTLLSEHGGGITPGEVVVCVDACRLSKTLLLFFQHDSDVPAKAWTPKIFQRRQLAVFISCNDKGGHVQKVFVVNDRGMLDNRPQPTQTPSSGVKLDQSFDQGYFKTRSGRR